MLDKAMGQALGGVSESYLESAMGVYDRKRKERRRWRKVTAVAVAVVILFGALVFWPEGGDPSQPGIIAIPGVMKVYASEIELSLNEEAHDGFNIGGGIASGYPIWMPYTSVAGFGIPLTFSVPESPWADADITFQVSVEYGYFLDNKMDANKLGSSIILNNRDKVYWRGTSISDIAEAVGENGMFFADVIIYADEYVVGYGVVTFVYVNRSCMAYSAKTVGFPMIDGYFQSVTEEYVRQRIAEYKYFVSIQEEGEAGAVARE